MKKFFVAVAVLIICLFIYVVVVIIPNRAQKKKYEDCAQNSITEQQAQRYNYAGNIRNDKVSPKTCYDGRETLVEPMDSPLLP